MHSLEKYFLFVMYLFTAIAFITHLVSGLLIANLLHILGEYFQLLYRYKILKMFYHIFIVSVYLFYLSLVTLS